MINILKTNQNDFNHSKLPVLFHDKEFVRSYYFLISNNIAVSKFSAQSEIEPVAKSVNNMIAVGVDQLIGFWSISLDKVIKNISFELHPKS